MKRNIKKEKLALIINKRFSRITNYLKKLNKTKTIQQNTFNIVLSIILHDIYLNTITNQNTSNFIIEHLKNNYVNEYIKLVEYQIDNSIIESLLLEMKKIIKTEEDIFNINEDLLISLFITCDIKEFENLKNNIIKTYNAIKKAYKYVEIID